MLEMFARVLLIFWSKSRLPVNCSPSWNDFFDPGFLVLQCLYHRRFTNLRAARRKIDEKKRTFFLVRAVRIFIMLARCSKCDFRNLGIIWDRNMWSEKNAEMFLGLSISIPNDLKIPKITLRTACDQYKNTSSAQQKKVAFFSLPVTELCYMSST